MIMLPVWPRHWDFDLNCSFIKATCSWASNTIHQHLCCQWMRLNSQFLLKREKGWLDLIIYPKGQVSDLHGFTERMTRGIQNADSDPDDIQEVIPGSYPGEKVQGSGCALPSQICWSQSCSITSPTTSEAPGSNCFQTVRGHKRSHKQTRRPKQYLSHHVFTSVCCTAARGD